MLILQYCGFSFQPQCYLNKYLMKDINELRSAWKGHRDFANWLVNKLQPTTIVDLGVDYGFSLFCFAEPNIGRVYGIDSFEGDIHAGSHTDAYETVVNYIQENQYTNIELIKGFFDDVVVNWNKNIDILHIDGLHTYEAALNDYQQWSKFVPDNGIILMHDTVAFPAGVGRVYNEITLPKLNFPHSAGLGVVSKNEELINQIREKFNQ